MILEIDETFTTIYFQGHPRSGSRSGDDLSHSQDYFLGHLLGDDLINPVKMSVRPSVYTRGSGAKKNSLGLKGSEGETRIWVDGGVLLGGKSSQKLLPVSEQL